MVRPILVGNIQGVKIYESKYMARGGAIALPGFGIVLYHGGWTKYRDRWIVFHEYGHFIQCKLIGKFRFYTLIGVLSVFSAIKSRWIKEHRHMTFWTERSANFLAYHHFWKPRDWPMWDYPMGN